MTKHNFKKQFGQNFLRNNRYAEKMIDMAGITSSSNVLEIGPGDGRVTDLLLRKAKHVLAVEIDYDIIVLQIKRFGDQKKFDIIHKDIMQMDPTEVTEVFGSEHFVLIGSLPYNISKQIIRKFLQFSPKIESMTFIIQEEVAQAYTATAPNATYLSNWISLYADVKKGVSIPRKQFFPTPKVNGGILNIIPKTMTADELNTAATISKIMRIGFASPRKTLRNNLKSNNEIDDTKLDELLDKLDIDKQRPAEITLEQWQNLAALK